jgi:hypothetical protein
MLVFMRRINTHSLSVLIILFFNEKPAFYNLCNSNKFGRIRGSSITNPQIYYL